MNKKKIVINCIGLAVCIVLAVVFGVLMKAQAKKETEIVKEAQVRAENRVVVPADKLPRGELEIDDEYYRYFDQVETYLFVGTDNNGYEEEDGEYHGGMADFLMLLVLNKTKEKYALIQIDRDTMMKVPILRENGEEGTAPVQQLCISHYYGSNARESDTNTVNCVSRLLGGLDIDGYYVLNMKYIKQLNKAAGGVTVTFDEDLTEIDPAFKEGETVTLTGDQAEALVRSRMGVGEGTNEERMARQKIFLNGFFETVRGKSADDGEFINTFYRSMMDMASTNLSSGIAANIANQVANYEDMGVLKFDGEHKEEVSTTDNLLHMQFIVDKASIAKTLTPVLGLETYEPDEEDEDYVEEDEDEDLDEEDDTEE
ncbi:MAG: LCP family protein [Lachnospiraceae bacterium]|nr:LCP family protein [Lachnospiraceae bacterium]